MPASRLDLCDVQHGSLLIGAGDALHRREGARPFPVGRQFAAPFRRPLLYDPVRRARQTAGDDAAVPDPHQRHDIEHRLTKPNHPWANGQVDRMNRTLKEATVKRYHYDSHDQLRAHLADFLAACNFAKRLKTLKGLAPHEHACKRWSENPGCFSRDPIHHATGLYI